MRLNKFSFTATLVFLLMCGCSRADANKCHYFSLNYPRRDLPTIDLTEISLSAPQIKLSLTEIQNCYRSHRYMDFDNELKIQKALKYKEKDLFLILAELEGVSDLIIIFEIDRNGRIVGVYQSSLQ